MHGAPVRRRKKGCLHANEPDEPSFVAAREQPSSGTRLPRESRAKSDASLPSPRCPHSVTPWHLRALIAAGVSNLLDLYVTPEEILRVLQSVARGDVVLHVHLTNTNGHGAALEDITAGKERNGETRSRR